MVAVCLFDTTVNLMRIKSCLLPQLRLLTLSLALSISGCGGSGGGESDFSKVSDKSNPPPASTNSGSANTGNVPVTTGTQPIATGARQTPPSTSIPPTVVGSPRIAANSPPVAALRGLVSTTDNGVLNVNGYVLMNNTGVAALPGETVTVNVAGNQISALRIDPHSTGAITEIASDHRTLVVAGQKIALNSETIVERTSIDGLAIGNVVAVSGVELQAGVFLATNITQLAPADTGNLYTTDISGVVEQLDERQRTFHLGELQVDYANGIVSTNLHDGAMIYAQGKMSSRATLIADSIAPLIDFNLLTNATAADSLSLSGSVSEVTTQAFFILGLRVVRNEHTVVTNGNVVDVLPQCVVAVTGHFDAVINSVVADTVDILSPAMSDAL